MNGFEQTARSARAAVFHGPNEPFTVERVSIPELRRGEILARINCTTICGSDLHSYYGRRAAPSPSILGHEMVGTIVSANGPVRQFTGGDLQAGDRISWSMVWSCGDCFYCRRHLRPKCERLMKFGHERTNSEFPLGGGFSTHCVLPVGTPVFRVPENVPDAVASTANCATATVAAMFRAAGSVAGKSIVIYGAGMLGVTACAMAETFGAQTVIAIDSNPQRAAMGLQFGANHAMESSLPAGELVSHVRRLTGGRGADLVFDLTGDPAAMETGFELLRFGGRFVLAGAVYPARPLSISAEQIVRRMIQINGVYNYAPEDLGTALSFLAPAVSRYPFEQLVGRTFSLDAIQEAFHYAEQQRPPRVAIRPGDSIEQEQI